MIGQFPIQSEIWHKKANSYTYEQIIATVEGITSKHMISTCLRRTALCLPWHLHFKGGTDNYLCDEDMNYLIEYLSDNASDNNCLRTFEVIDAAHSLKLFRHQIAIRRLISINCNQLAAEISLNVDPPSRSWLNDLCLNHSFTLNNTQEIDRDRYKAGYREDIMNWLFSISSRVLNVPWELVFNADETVLSGKRIYNGVTDRERAIAEEQMSFAHMTAMVTINAAGARIPHLLYYLG